MMLTNNVLQDNPYNVIHHASSLSISMGIESRNKILTIISKLMDNVQKLLVQYNKAFTFSIQSLSSDLHNFSSMQHKDVSSLVWSNTLNHIQTCLMLQDKMWKELLHHKTAAGSELLDVHRNIHQLQQQKFILINPVNTFHLVPAAPAVNTVAVREPHGVSSSLIFLHNNASDNGQLISSAAPAVHYIANGNTAKTNNTINIHPIVSIPSTNLCNNVNPRNDLKNVAKKKRKRRGYNGPYSVEEKQFMIDFYHQNKCDSTKDIVALSHEMEKKFKVRRSPYGLAQKMYQMNIINSRLKALFQRQFEDENKGQMVLDEETEKDNKVTTYTTTDSCCYIKRKPFMAEEVQFIQELITKYNNENSRKLYWRFLQRFVDWKNDSKSYQRFYHKYWTLKIHEQKNKNGQSRDVVQENKCSPKNERKRPCIDAVNEPRKRMKSSGDHNKDEME